MRWDYRELIPQFASRQDYAETIKPRRIEYLKGLIAQNNPEVVIGYVKAFWSDYKELFDGFDFKQTDWFQTAYDGNSLVILTGHFSARSMNGRFDDVVEIIKEHRVT